MTKCTTVIGIDIGDKYSHVIELEGATDDVLFDGRIASTPKALAAMFQTRRRARLVLEAGCHSGWMSRALAEWGHEVFVANPRRIQLSQNHKSDRVDAEMLARIGRVDPKLLQPVKLRTKQTQVALATLRSRQALVKTRTLLVNHVRAMVKTVGMRLPTCSAASFHKLADGIPTELQPALKPLMENLEQLTAKIRAFDRDIERMSTQQYPHTERLRQIAGVGPQTALAYVLVIEDPNRFRKGRSVGAYIGLCPRRSQSGDSDPQLRITKAGDPMLRSLLVNAAHYILGPFGPDTDLRRWGQKLASRGGKNAKKRASVAVARKLAGILHALWRTGDDYEPLRTPPKTTEQLEGSGPIKASAAPGCILRSPAQPPHQAPRCAAP